MQTLKLLTSAENCCTAVALLPLTSRGVSSRDGKRANCIPNKEISAYDSSRKNLNPHLTRIPFLAVVAVAPVAVLQIF